jgi:hypothetical protein
MTDSGGLPESASAAWWRLIDEAEELAEDYREWGRDVLVVHPGDVTAVRKSGRFGLSVLAPDSEYDRIRSLAERHRFERSHVYRRVEDGLCFLLCVFEGSGDEAVVFVPAYASETDLDMLYPLAQEAGEMPVLVRPLEYEECVTLTVADPDLFFLPGSDG